MVSARGCLGSGAAPGAPLAEVGLGESVQYRDLPAHLGQPGGAHVGAYAIVVHQYQARAAHAGDMVGFLNQLASGRGAGARQVTGFVFLGRAYVEQVGGAVVLVLPLGQTGQVEAFDAGAVGDGTGALGGGLASVLGDRTEASRLAVFQLLTGQRPADGAVA